MTDKKCGWCNGSGGVQPDRRGIDENICPECDGVGSIAEYKNDIFCPRCKGINTRQDERRVLLDGMIEYSYHCYGCSDDWKILK